MKIVIDCGQGGPNYEWGPYSVEDGVGGSEEQVIMLAAGLSGLGHRVIVRSNCGPDTIVCNNVVYTSKDNDFDEYDVLIGWRNYGLLAVRRAPVQLLWCHDIPQGMHCPHEYEISQGVLDNIDGVVLLNRYHSDLYSKYIPASKRFICEIGAYTGAFLSDQPERIHGRAIYMSHPGRGLHILRDYWPKVREICPEATLQACWWEEDQFLPPNEDIGILPMKRLGTHDLAMEIAQSEVFAYPSVFGPEISPASCIKAQIGGAVPVIVAEGGMAEVTQWGKKTAMHNFAQELGLALISKTYQHGIRGQMQSWARNKYCWKSSVARWDKLLMALTSQGENN